MYLKIELLETTNCHDEPHMIYSELNSLMVETRHLDIFSSNKVGYALKNIEYRGSFLTEGIFMDLEDLKSVKNQKVTEITKEEFEAVWKKRVTIVKQLIGYLFYRNKMIK